MATVSRSTKVSGGTTLVSNTVARAADVETDMLTLFNAHNNHDSGTSKWTVVSALNASATPLIADNSSGTNNIFEAKDNGVTVLTVADGGVTTVLANGGSNKALIANNGTSTGNIFEAQDNGSAVLTVADGGTVTAPTLASTTATLTTATITTLAHTVVGYRRPTLKWISITTVDVENNTGTANQTSIMFPDGSVRSVTEDTASTNKYRRFDITVNAQFTSGTEDSGLRTSLSEATNTWYAIYAVKSVIDTTKFVLVGDTVIPTQGNFATLNSNFGTNGWVFLGYIRNGDNCGSTGDILKFYQSGNMTIFYNELSTTTGMTLATGSGSVLALTGAATSLSWAYSAGTGTTNVPNTIGHIDFVYGVLAAGAGAIHVQDSGAAHLLRRYSGASLEQYGDIWRPANDGLYVTTSGAGSTKFFIAIGGFVDTALGVGNPVL